MPSFPSGDALPMPIPFNVQTFLSEMRKELREDHHRLVERVDAGFAEINDLALVVRDQLGSHTLDDHRAFQALDTRLSPIEAAMKMSNDRIKWSTRTVIAAVVVGCIDLLFHWGRRP